MFLIEQSSIYNESKRFHYAETIAMKSRKLLCNFPVKMTFWPEKTQFCVFSYVTFIIHLFFRFVYTRIDKIFIDWYTINSNNTKER